MRWIVVCLFSLFAITMAAPSADASSRRPEARAGKVVKPVQASSTRTASRPAAAPQRAAARTPARPQATARQATSRVARPATRQQQQATARNNNRRVAKATGNSNRNTRTATAQRSGMISGGARLTSWQSGLPTASGEQRDCPAGTMSTLARGHDDIVRCMPL